MYLTRKQKELIAVGIAAVIIVPVVLVSLFLASRNMSIGRSERQTALTNSSQPSLPRPPLVTYVEGIVDGQIEEQEDWRPIGAGAELTQQSVIRTDIESAADIRIQNGSIVRVMEATTFTLASLGTQEIRLEVDEGEIVTRLERLVGDQELLLTGRDTVAGVRGTELAVTVDAGATTVFGMSGRVEVWNPAFPRDTVELGIHQKSTITDGQPSAPEPMTHIEIARYALILSSLHEQQVFLVSRGITFSPDSAELTAEAEEELQRINQLLQLVDFDFRIVGHTADIGTPESQMALSAERATRVMEYLVELGVPASRLSATGAGGSRPIAAGTDADSNARNRRVEFIVIRD